ncbi:hypothetical protein EVA_17046 [gut metagenome]|uniref:Uncharacterized protein n=1 Tax=gut metagenome TaxID=749906 RepID=J9FZ68_9ZZZZ
MHRHGAEAILLEGWFLCCRHSASLPILTLSSTFLLLPAALRFLANLCPAQPLPLPALSDRLP